MTLSVPLIINVPFSVIRGKSPIKTVCSLISPVSRFMKVARTKIEDEYVISRSRHSSTVNFGGGHRSSSLGSKTNSSERVSLKSVMGLISRNVSVIP